MTSIIIGLTVMLVLAGVFATGIAFYIIAPLFTASLLAFFLFIALAYVIGRIVLSFF